MQRDILDFNSPIELKSGQYSHLDHDYSIKTICISDFDLAIQIINLLQELKAEIMHPELETSL